MKSGILEIEIGFNAGICHECLFFNYQVMLIHSYLELIRLYPDVDEVYLKIHYITTSTRSCNQLC